MMISINASSPQLFAGMRRSAKSQTARDAITTPLHAHRLI
jgi:hypothetical protein